MKNIFVYGTLLEGCRNYDLYLKGHVHQVTPALVKGTLYSLKMRHYPALLPGDEFIHGEMMEVDDEVIPAIDRLESYMPGNLYNEYNKEDAQIYDTDRNPLCVLPVYFYNIAHPGQRDLPEVRILSNDYRQWLSAQKKE